MSADINSVYFSPIPSLRHKLFNERYSAAAALSYDTIVEFNVVGSLCNEVAYISTCIFRNYIVGHRTPYLRRKLDHLPIPTKTFLSLLLWVLVDSKKKA